MIGAVSRGLKAERRGAAQTRKAPEAQARHSAPKQRTPGKRRRKAVKWASSSARSRTRWLRRFSVVGAVLAGLGLAALADWVLNPAPETGGFDTPFEAALAGAFPEAIAKRTTARFATAPIGGAENLPVSATLYLPDYALGALGAAEDPFTRLASAFRSGRFTLTGPELAARMDAVVTAAGLPDGLPRCPTYVIGDPVRIDQGAGVSLAARRFDILINPGC